jgi:lipid II:glycine glycyltransferase (peptidoglycan interpeptide bridge formation enzyme)
LIFEKLALKKSERNIQPKYTLILNLTPTEEELLNQMHAKWRYNIRLAEKKGVKIIVDNTRVEEFYRLLVKTEERKGVKFFPVKYFNEIMKYPGAKLYLAEFDGKIVAANIMIFSGQTATYLFGGTDYEYRAVMAPHLLQWQAILDAKSSGCEFYDFWGAAPENVSGHEAKWRGVTQFKVGFAPNQPLTEYLGTFEKVYRPKMLKIYQWLQRIK